MPMAGIQQVITEKDQTGGKSTVFDDVNPTELVTENMEISTIRDFKDMSDGVVNYLKRAILINTFTWTSGTSGRFLTIDPWAYLSTNTVIRDKVKHFSLLKGKLHVRIVTNGTPFHYGRIIASYVPFYNAQTTQYQNKYNALPLMFQVQHVEINPTTSLPVEMQLEMYTDSDAIGLQGQTTMSLGDLGRILFSVLAPLGSANAASPDPITVQTYAWWDDVSLGAPTPYTEVLQAGDEMVSKGPISSVASSVATAASYFKDIPIIGRFAMATEIGAKAVGGIAGLFGMSNPPIANKGELFKTVAATNFCQVTGRDSSKLLTMDPLRQLTIDPKAYGFPPRDEMSFAFLYKIPQYLRPITWNSTQAPGTMLALIGVSPCTTWQTIPSAGVVDHHMAPIGLMAHNSGNWTGALKFRFKVVCSPYHKGRLLFRYHPYRTSGAIVGYGEVTSQSVIFDIGLDSEKELVVNWSRPQLWLTTNNAVAPFDSNLDSNTTGGGNNLNCPVFCNGEISVEVLTELTAPFVSPITVHAFVEGTDSLRFCDWTNSTFAITQTGAAMQAGGDPELAHGEVKSTTLGTYSKTPDNLMKVTVGEEIASLRALLRRPTVYGYNYSTDTGTVLPAELALVGFYYANNVFDFDPAASSLAAKQAIQSNMQIWKNCYAAVKGTVRYKIMRINKRPDVIKLQATQLIRTEKWSATPIYEDISAVGGNGSLATIAPLKGSGWAYLPPTDDLIEFEVPDLSTKKYRLTNSTSVRDAVLVLDRFIGLNNSSAALAAEIMYEVMISAGEDFNLMFFTGVPILRVNSGGWVSDNNYPNRNL